MRTAAITVFILKDDVDDSTQIPESETPEIHGTYVPLQGLSHFRLFCDPTGCCTPGPSIHGISQVRILE